MPLVLPGAYVRAEGPLALICSWYYKPKGPLQMGRKKKDDVQNIYDFKSKNCGSG